MQHHNQAFLLQQLNTLCQSALNEAANMAHIRGHKEITLDHFFLKLLANEESDIAHIFRRYEIDTDEIWKTLLNTIDRLPHNLRGNPELSISLHDILTDAWLIASQTQHQRIRSVDVYRALLNKPFKLMSYAQDRFITSLSETQLLALMNWLDSVSTEVEMFHQDQSLDAPLSETTDPTSNSIDRSNQSIEQQQILSQYTTDLTEKARNNQIDPVFGRENEIRQMMDILTRRRKNNPILVGEPGVGKTALAEGLALKISQNEVPEVLKSTRILSLDMGLLQAGASVKGAFEQRLKQVIEAVQAAAEPILLFIDEAHTLIGAGNQAGGSDAANLLKPALARGELRTIAATTWSEYKQYFEQDAALERRFQMVKVNEPDDETAYMMLRGLQQRYAQHHHVHIQDEAIVAAVKLSRQYINGRQLPDKAIDLLDTAAARVRMSLDTPPLLLDKLRAKEETIIREINLLNQDLAFQNNEEINQKIQLLSEQQKQLQQQISDLENRYQQQSHQAVEILAEDLDTEKRQNLLAQFQQDKDRLVYLTVNTHVIAQVIADWTGIPLASLLKNEATQLLQLDHLLQQRVVGQDEALQEMANTLRYAKMGIRSAEHPLGVFLLTGPSGVGKTETALALAETLFGGERSLISINLSEYQEAHTVSQLKGSPPGYVGYGQGGVLTEAVRQQPYSIVLLDEVEKAHRDVLNLFYQVFDKGIMRDGEGREIDFKNTVIVMTANLGSNELISLFEQSASDNNNSDNNDENSETEVAPEPTHYTQFELQEMLHPLLTAHFQAALLARMQVLVYRPLDNESLATIARMKLDKLVQQLAQQKCQLYYDDTLAIWLANACSQNDMGARNIDSVLNRHILPSLAQGLLSWQSNSGQLPKKAQLLIADGELDIMFES